MVERKGEGDSMINRARGTAITKDQLLCESFLAEIEVQAINDAETLALCLFAAINARDKVTESGKRREPFFQVMQGPKEAFPASLRRLTSAVERSVSDPSARKDNN